MKIKEQITICRSEDAADPGGLGKSAPGRLDQGRDVFHNGFAADERGSARQIFSCTLYTVHCAWRSGEVADFHTPSANEREVLGPKFRFHPIDKAGHLFQASRRNGSGRPEPHADPMKNNRDLRCQGLERFNFPCGGVEKIVGDDFQQIDATEIAENSRGEIGTPAEADFICECFDHLSFRNLHTPRLHNHRRHIRRHRNWRRFRRSCWSPSLRTPVPDEACEVTVR